MSDAPLIITEIDYDSILQNLKNWYKAQDQFKDYDFDGSALAILIKNLAYNTHYNAFYNNMVANEGFITTAVLARNIYSHAKTLNYLPGSRTAAEATIKITITPPVNYVGSSFTIPKYQQFVSEAIDGVNYSFVVNQDVTASRVTVAGAEPFVFSQVVLLQGEPLIIKYSVDQTTNPKLRFEIPSANVDIETLTVQTQVSLSNTLLTNWTRSTDITSMGSTTTSYFLERGSNGNYTVYFGDGSIGLQPNTGNILILSYVVTSGEAANKANAFTMLPLQNVSSVVINPILAAAGGTEEEQVDSIKSSAPIYYAAQNRAVTKSDFEVIIKKDFPQVGSVSVWGGEENNPPIYGKIFVSVAPAAGYLISQAQKDAIIKKLVDERVTVSLNPVIKDPDYTYLRVKADATYNGSKTALTSGALETLIRNSIIDFNEQNLRVFGSKFILSRLTAAIDATNPAIIGNDTKIFLEKRFNPFIGKSETYTLDFNAELKRGSVLEHLQSSAFSIIDDQGVIRSAYFEEKPLAYTGIDDIVVIDSGSGYLDPPEVQITGDGNGANAVAVIVNGRVTQVKIVDKGDSYTTALITLVSTNGGSGASAKPIIAARYGQLRIYYYNNLQQKIILQENAGTIDYATGVITIEDFNPSDYNDYIAIWLQTEEPIIESTRGNILIIDSSDAGSINIVLQESD